MAGIITINFKVLKNGMADLGMKSPIYIPGPVEPQFGPGRYIYFEGFSVDEHGKQHYMDVTVAYRQTTLRKSLPLLSKQVLANGSLDLIFPPFRCNRVSPPLWLQRLSNLPAPVMCAHPGPCCRNCRHSQRMHDHRAAH